MTTLEEAWSWYTAAADSLRRLDRLAEKYWSDLPWDGALGRDNKLRHVEANRASADAQTALDELDDLAIVLLFSVFEGIVRATVAEQIRQASGELLHPVLKAAARDAIEIANRGSFAQILQSYSRGGQANLAEQVRQIRRYRNWVSHGRRGKQPAKVLPRTAYERLRQFLVAIARTE